jgi:hypothetical protein
MKHLCALFCFVLVFMVPAFAQANQEPAAQAPSAQTPPAETVPAKPLPPPYVAPYEVSGGYSIRMFTESNSVRVGLNGAYGSLQYNILSRVGAVVEVSGGVRNQGLNGNLSIYSALAGPQIYPFKHRRTLTPFAHFLVGENFYRNDYPAYGGFPHTVSTNSSFGWEAGGGFDWVYKTHWEIRLIELDYAPTKFFGGSRQTGYRGSIGVIYRFGRKK